MQITKLERKPNVWRVRLDYKNELRRRAFKYFTVRGSADDADAFIARIKSGQNLTGYKDPDNIETYLKQWIKYRLQDKQIRPSSAETYHLYFRSIVETIGKLKIQDVSKTMLNELYRELLKKHSAHYVKQMSIVFHKALKDAVLDGLLPIDPTIGTKRPSAKKEYKSTTLTVDQIKLVLEESRKLEWGFVIRFLLATGLRRGELCALQIQDIDLSRNVIHIRRNLVRYDKSYHIGQPKTRHSARTVSVPEEVCNELRQIIADKQPNDLLIKGYSPSCLTTKFARFFTRLGMSGFTMHDLRHAHATFLLSQKMGVKAVAQRLGHANVAITLGVYSHVLPGDDEVLATQVNKLF